MKLLREINWKHNSAAVVAGFGLSLILAILSNLLTHGSGFWLIFIYAGFAFSYLLSRADSIKKIVSWTLIIVGLMILPMHYLVSYYDSEFEYQKYKNAADIMASLRNLNASTAEIDAVYHAARNEPTPQVVPGTENSTFSLLSFAGGVLLILAGYWLQNNPVAQGKEKRRKKP